MASSKEYLDFILEQLSELEDVTYRAMMGEYIIYYGGKIVGGIYDDRFLVKPTKFAMTMMPNAEMELPYEGAKKMILVNNVEDKDFLKEILVDVIMLFILDEKVMRHKISGRLLALLADRIQVCSLVDKKPCDVVVTTLKSRHQRQGNDPCCAASIGEVFVQRYFAVKLFVDVLDVFQTASRNCAKEIQYIHFTSPCKMLPFHNLYL